MSKKGFTKRDKQIHKNGLISNDRKEVEEKRSKDFWKFSD